MKKTFVDFFGSEKMEVREKGRSKFLTETENVIFQFFGSKIREKMKSFGFLFLFFVFLFSPSLWLLNGVCCTKLLSPVAAKGSAVL